MCDLAVILFIFLHLALGELKPKFNQTPEHVTVTAGNKAILPCTVEFLGDHTVIWSNPRKTLISHADRRMLDDHRISVERPYIKEWNLHIRDVRHNDSGTYKCEINTDPIQAKLVTLSVLVPPMIISRYSSDLVVKEEGETAELICNVTGIPAPNVTWYKRNYRQGKNHREQIGLEGGVLLIHNVSRFCDDIYDCFVDNGVSPAVSKAIRVEVQYAPEVILTNKRIGQRRRKETILECTIYAHPQSITVWKRNGQKISQKGDKYSIEAYEDQENRMVTLSLRIMDLDDNDFGVYTCEGSNPLGRDSEDMILYAIEPEPTTPSTTTSSYEQQYEVDVEIEGGWKSEGGISRHDNYNNNNNNNNGAGWIEGGGWEKSRMKPTPGHVQPTKERQRPVGAVYPDKNPSRTIASPGGGYSSFQINLNLIISLLILTVSYLHYSI